MKIMSIRFADDIIKEIINRDKIPVKNDCVTGEQFEKWLRGEKKTIVIELENSLPLDCEVKINGQNKN